MKYIRRVISFLLLRPFVWLFIRFKKVENKWEKLEMTIWPIPLKTLEMSHFQSLEETLSEELSSNDITSLDDMKHWLLSCEYDYEKYESPSNILHPVDFEKTKKGLCGDYSLWTWRKLKELGYYCEFVYGWCDLETRHALIQGEITIGDKVR